MFEPFDPDVFEIPPTFQGPFELPPLGDSVVVITVDGIDVTVDVNIWTARFESFVNGKPGNASIRIRDEDRTKSYLPGMPVLLTIDDFPTWRGFVSSVKRVYVGPAYNVDDFGLARFIDLDCVDINILFERRIVFNQADPDNVYGTLFPPDTDDNVAINDLIDNFLDLSGDDIDTLSRVEFVGPLDPAQSSRAWSGGFTWGEAMSSIAMVPAAIFYIDPSKRLVYTDVDTPNAPFALSDVVTPGGGGGGGGSCVFLDEWDRIESGTWGTSTDGHEWLTALGDATLSVDGASGIAANGTLSARASGSEGQEKWEAAYVFETTFRFDQAPGDGEYIDLSFRVFDTTTLVSHYCILYFSNTVGDPSLLIVLDSAPTEVAIDTPPADTTINIKWEYTPEGLNRAKVWWTGAEPDWMVSRTDGNVPQVNQQDLLIFSSSATETVTVEFGPLEFCSTAPDPPAEVTVGQYREMEILLDGANLANDVLCWGFGYGSNEPVFVRAQDAPSQTEHGLWQLAQSRPGVFVQATIDRIADSILNGSPTNHRGQKDNREAVIVTTYQPGFLPAQKVVFESQVFNYSTTLPIRKMEVTFVNPTTPKYVLSLSLDIDSPWGFVDGFMWDLPDFQLPVGPMFPTPGPCECGITDSFGRTIAVTTNSASGTLGPGPYIGTADCTLTWDVSLVDGSEASVTPNHADFRFFKLGSTVGIGSAAMYLAADMEPIMEGAQHIFQFSMDRIMGDAVNQENLLLNFRLADGMTGFIEITGGTFYSSEIGFLADGTTSIPASFWVAGTTYTVTITSDGTRMWIAVAGPGGSYVYTHSSATQFVVGPLFVTMSPVDPVIGGAHDDLTVTWYRVQVPEITRCSQYKFDRFGRTSASEWGEASSGLGTWAGSGTGNPSVDGNVALVEPDTGQVFYTEEISADVYRGTAGFTMTVLWKVDVLPGVGTTIYIDFSVYSASLGDGATFEISQGALGDRIDVYSNSEFAETPFTLLADTWYFAKWEHVPGQASRAKVWTIDESEPGWQVSRPAEVGITTEGDAVLQILMNGSATVPTTFSYEWIDFGYAGAPCYCLPTDTFDRDDAFGWLDSNGGLTWVPWVFAGAATGVPGNVLYSVLSPTATIVAPVSTVLTSYVGQSLADADVALTAQVVLNPGDADSQWVVANPLRVRYQTKIDSASSSGNSSLSGIVHRFGGVCLGLSTNTITEDDGGGNFLFDTETLMTWMAAWANGGFPTLHSIFGASRRTGSLGIESSSEATSTFNLATDTWYNILWEFHRTINPTPSEWATNVFYKIWALGASEPTSLSGGFRVDSTTNSGDASKTYKSIGVNLETDTGNTRTEDYRFFGVSGLDACSIVLQPGIATTPSGSGCETPTRLSSTQYETSSRFTPGTTQVYVNGFRLRLGDDYDEDPGNTSVTLGTPVDVVDVVTICYVVAIIPLGGGPNGGPGGNIPV